jgi:hypothetical protein
VKVTNDAVKSLSFYNEAPQDELTLDEFELFSLDRLQLLRNIETLRTKGYEGNELNNKLGLVSVLAMINSPVPGPGCKHFYLTISLYRLQSVIARNTSYAIAKYGL